jgi:hypothetical protein
MFSKNTYISDFTKIHPVGTELSHAHGWMDRHDKTNNRFQNFANAPTYMEDKGVLWCDAI